MSTCPCIFFSKLSIDRLAELSVGNISGILDK